MNHVKKRERISQLLLHNTFHQRNEPEQICVSTIRIKSMRWKHYFIAVMWRTNRTKVSTESEAGIWKFLHLLLRSMSFLVYTTKFLYFIMKYCNLISFEFEWVLLTMSNCCGYVGCVVVLLLGLVVPSVTRSFYLLILLHMILSHLAYI